MKRVLNNLILAGTAAIFGSMFAFNGPYSVYTCALGVVVILGIAMTNIVKKQETEKTE